MSSMNLIQNTPVVANTPGFFSPLRSGNLEEFVQREREKLIAKTVKSKQLTMLQFAKERERKLKIQKLIDKKQKKAEKTVVE